MSKPADLNPHGLVIPQLPLPAFDMAALTAHLAAQKEAHNRRIFARLVQTRPPVDPALQELVDRLSQRNWMNVTPNLDPNHDPAPGYDGTAS